MDHLIQTAQGDVDAIVVRVAQRLMEILERKRQAIAWKLASLRPAFEREVLQALVEQRERQGQHL
jgi:hypothetical protein